MLYEKNYFLTVIQIENVAQIFCFIYILEYNIVSYFSCQNITEHCLCWDLFLDNVLKAMVF